MGKSWDVVGYTYAADQYCRSCMWRIAVNWITAPATLRKQMESETVKDALDLLAKHIGINRQDEGSYDSDTFPKVIFESQTCQENCGDDSSCNHGVVCEEDCGEESCDHEWRECGHDRCGGCGERLCEQ